MQKFFVLTIILLSLACGVFAQTVKPTPPADDDVVKISTTLIQLDVTVTDKSGKIVRDLKPGDFEVYENGQKQDVSGFSFISSVRTQTQTEAVKKVPAKQGVPLPPRTLRPDQVRRTIALVVDDITLSFQSAARVRTALKRYVDEQMREGDLVAIIRTGGNIGALQQFSSNKQQLYAAIEKVRWNPRGRGRTGSFVPLNEIPESVDQRNAADKKAQDEFDASVNDFQESTFASGTLGALRFIVSGMSELPGRKSVILFSDGPEILTHGETGSFAASRVLEFLRRVVEEANRASVVFYTIDARGLEYTGLTAADKVKANPNAMGMAMSARGGELFETQQALAILANNTGGFPIINQNDIVDSVRKIVDDQSYYLIAYEPDADTFDAKTRKFNTLEIKVKRPGLKVRYRSGFFNVAEENTPKTSAPLDEMQQLGRALTSPFAANDISLRLNAISGNNLQGDFVTALLHINTGDLQFTDNPDGSKKAVLDILAVTFGDNGTPIDRVARTFSFDIQPKVYNDVLKEGFLCNFTFPVAKPGAYQFRVAVRDAQAQKVGSASQFIEIPDLKKDRLTLSGILVENFNQAQWLLFTGEKPTPGSGAESTNIQPTDPFMDTSVRRFKRGTILRYGLEVYNAKLDTNGKAYLKATVKIFKDDKLVMDGREVPVDYQGQADLTRIKAGGAISLLDNMLPGDYVLQIIITDDLGKEKQKIASQYVQFEVFE